MTNRATGSFEVDIKPQTPPGETVGRLLLTKRFHGDLEATSAGEMLAVRIGVEGSAGYVAMEQVVGTLKGRSGSFALQHSGTMVRGSPTLSVTVVPDSGAGALTGITGDMAINVADGAHSYVFHYNLP